MALATSNEPGLAGRRTFAFGIAALSLSLVGCGVLVLAFLLLLKQAIVEAVGESLATGLERMVVSLDFSLFLRVGDIEAAYGLTTDDFQDGESLEDFIAFVEEHPELRDNWVKESIREQAGDRFVDEVTTEGEDGRRSTFTLEFRREEGRWRVARIDFP
jgi:hypothetical protein